MVNLKKHYNLSVIILALTSIIFVVLDFFGKINISVKPYKRIDLTILTFFWIDYIVRMWSAKDKKLFF